MSVVDSNIRPIFVVYFGQFEIGNNTGIWGVHCRVHSVHTRYAGCTRVYRVYKGIRGAQGIRGVHWTVYKVYKGVQDALEHTGYARMYRMFSA